MKALIKAVLLAGLLIVSLPEQASAQGVWERVQEAIERERAERDTERERAQRQGERQTERGSEARRTDRQRAATRPAERRAEERGRDHRTDQRRGGRAHDAQPHQRRGGQAGGPAFCRSGAGHPVHGIQWCHQKGFATPTWHRGTLGDVIIGRDTRRSGSATGGVLERVLGRDATRRATELGQRVGLTGDLEGTWLDASTLELTIGGVPIARLVDEALNGRVDYALIAEY